VDGMLCTYVAACGWNALHTCAIQHMLHSIASVNGSIPHMLAFKHLTHVGMHATHVGIAHVCACDTCCMQHLLHCTQACIAHKLAFNPPTHCILDTCIPPMFAIDTSCITSQQVAFHHNMLHSITTCCIPSVHVAFHHNILHSITTYCIPSHYIDVHHNMLHSITTYCIPSQHVAFHHYKLHSITTCCIPSLHYTSFPYKPPPQRPTTKRIYIHRRSRSIIPERGDDR